MINFTYDVLPGRILFGFGVRKQLSTELQRLGCARALILSTAGQERHATKRMLQVLPEIVIYDPEPTLTLPVSVSITSGINAVAHAVEALYAKDRNPIVSLMAQEAIRAFNRSLPTIVASPRDVSTRSDALYGTWLAGTCLGAVGMSLHHKLCHVLGGTFDLPHAETHTVVLPHAIAYNAPAEPAVMRIIADLFGAADASTGLFDFIGWLGAKQSLRELGMPEAGIEKAALLAVKNPYWNPRNLEHQPILKLIRHAWAGEAPKPTL